MSGLAAAGDGAGTAGFGPVVTGELQLTGVADIITGIMETIMADIMADIEYPSL